MQMHHQPGGAKMRAERREGRGPISSFDENPGGDAF